MRTLGKNEPRFKADLICKNVTGFTLIEVLIVVAIVGILASVVLVGLGPVQRRGRDARRISDLRQTQTALELHYNKNGAYPTGVSNWGDLRSKLVGSGPGLGINSIPNDPSSPTRNYVYGTDATGSSYVLGATLEDTTNPVFKDAPNGNIFNVGCGAPVYCLQL